jgi:uncharacterized protein
MHDGVTGSEHRRRELLRRGLLSMGMLATGRLWLGCGRSVLDVTAEPPRDRAGARDRDAPARANPSPVARPPVATRNPPPERPRRPDGGRAGSSAPDPTDEDAGTPPDATTQPPPPAGPRSILSRLGPLGAPDANGLRLPAGFTSRVVARSSQQVVAGSSYVWHPAPDGGATFATLDGGFVYVSNCEATPGGVGALRFDAAGQVVGAYPILQGSSYNCAGGPTPWRTWLSCEEVPFGRVWECDPLGVEAAVQRPALGLFCHEAAAVDPVHMQLYLTEDQFDGRLYRFTSRAVDTSGRPDLEAGRLEVAKVAGVLEGAVSWHAVPDPSGALMATRYQVPGSTAFSGGEGIWHHAGVIYFATKIDNRVWAYDVRSQRLTLLYDLATADVAILAGVDNVTVSPAGDVLVAEDGDDMQIVAIAPDGIPFPLLQLTGHDASEITGPAFDPSGTRLYFSSQRGATGFAVDGVTFEVSGRFFEPAE